MCQEKERQIERYTKMERVRNHFFSYSVLSDSGKKSSVLNFVCLKMENNMSKEGKSVLVVYICKPGGHVKSICVKSHFSEYHFLLQVDVKQ